MQVSATWCKGFSQAYCDWRQFALVHPSLQEVVAFVHCRVLYQGVSWSLSFWLTEELCNQHPSQVGG